MPLNGIVIELSTKYDSIINLRYGSHSYPLSSRLQVRRLRDNFQVKKNATVDDLINAYYKFILEEVTQSRSRRY